VGDFIWAVLRIISFGRIGSRYHAFIDDKNSKVDRRYLYE
jgi:hypothetical protein